MASEVEGGTATAGNASNNITVQGGSVAGDAGTLTLTGATNLTLGKATLSADGGATVIATNGALTVTGGSIPPARWRSAPVPR